MKAALYVRVSTMHQIDKDSLPLQRKELINYSKYILGIDDYEVFEDAGYSGKNTIRPKYQEMMSRIRAGEFTHLLVWKIDRVSRNLRDFSDMYDEIKKYNVTFISKNEQFDTSTAMGEAMLKIILIFAELERKLTGERVYATMLSRAEKGLWNGAPIPLGYRWDKDSKFPVMCEEESKTVQFIFNKYKELRSCMDVKHQLEVNNIPTKRNGTWTTKVIADIIRNPFYVGTYRYNYRYAPHGKIRPESEWVLVEDNHTAIIDKKLFEEVNSIMDKNRKQRGNELTRTLHTHVFSGLIRCNLCGSKYISSVDSPRADNYRPSIYRCFNFVHNKKSNRSCKGAIGEVKLGPFVMNYIANLVRVNDYIVKHGRSCVESDLEKMLLNGSVFENILGIEQADLEHTYNIMLKGAGDILFEPVTAEPDSIDIEIAPLEQSKKKLERAIERLEDLYLFSDDGISEKDYLVKKRSLEQRIEELDLSIKEKTKDQYAKLPGHDLSFIKKATRFLLAQNLTDSEFIDYNNMVKVIDKTLLKDFMNCVVRSVLMHDKEVRCIEFSNGLKHHFIYKPS